jgi:hypothetical protein
MSNIEIEEKVSASIAVPLENQPEGTTIKTFRSNSDIENFYRFIHENGLRREAGMLMEYALKKVSKLRKGKKAKTLQ